MRKENAIVFVLSALLIIAACYIFFDKYSDQQTAEKFAVYRQGISEGYTEAILKIADGAASCIPLTLTRPDNSTVVVIGAKCISGGRNNALPEPPAEEPPVNGSK